MTTIPGNMKPAKKPRYESRSLDSSLNAGLRYAMAHKLSQAYVFPTAYGYGIAHTTDRLPAFHPYFEITVDYKAYAYSIRTVTFDL